MPTLPCAGWKKTADYPPFLFYISPGILLAPGASAAVRSADSRFSVPRADKKPPHSGRFRVGNRGSAAASGEFLPRQKDLLELHLVAAGVLDKEGVHRETLLHCRRCQHPGSQGRDLLIEAVHIGFIGTVEGKAYPLVAAQSPAPVGILAESPAAKAGILDAKGAACLLLYLPEPDNPCVDIMGGCNVPSWEKNHAAFNRHCLFLLSGLPPAGPRPGAFPLL